VFKNIYQDRRPLIRAVFGSVLLVFTLGMTMISQANATLRDPSEYFFNQSFGDLREELATAKKEGKKGILMMFENTECPWCHKMKTGILNRSEVQEYFRKNFRILSIDTEGGTPITNFDGKEMPEKDYALKVNRVRATPVFMFFDLTGKPIVRYTGATRDLNEFMWLGQFVVDGKYKTMPFAKYKRERMAAIGE
jgi:thioredoxin-related protein